MVRTVQCYVYRIFHFRHHIPAIPILIFLRTSIQYIYTLITYFPITIPDISASLLPLLLHGLRPIVLRSIPLSPPFDAPGMYYSEVGIILCSTSVSHVEWTTI